jgi:uncharacterized protein
VASANEWGLVELDVDECLRLLEGQALGRLGFVREGEPEIRPLTYLLHEGSVLIRVAYGPTLDHLADRAKVVFEIDGEDEQGAWSVLVRGRAEEVSDPTELERLRALPLRPWAPGERAHYLRVLASSISGRRIAPA